jgi:transcriptional activator HAC1
MTPQSQSFDDDSMFGGSMSGTPGPEKKPVKKRKSWGQQLPEPKTNLPPRKRAKTEDEKEQRRVERVLRNRRAAQSSRERKRLEVEALENEKKDIEARNKQLEMRLADMEQRYNLLQQQLEAATGGKMTVFRGSIAASSPAQCEQAHQPITFSQDLFGSDHRLSSSQQPILDAHSNMQSAVRTVNPASLSPEIRPVAEASNASSSDTTQHSAVSVGRTTALDGFNNNQQFGLMASFGSDYPNFDHLFAHPESDESNLQDLDNTFLPITDAFSLGNDHLDGNHYESTNDFDINDFLHHDEIMQPAPEASSSDQLVEKTSSLQPQFGASSYGCDSGGPAVSV